MYNSKIIIEDMEFIKDSIKSLEDLQNKNILISGAYGMLATYITIFLLYINEKYNFNVNIIILVKSKEKAISKFENFDLTNLYIIESNLLDDISIDMDIDYIFHAASFGTPLMSDPIGVVEPNILGTINLLKLAKEKNVKSFLYFSSGAVYGYKKESEEITTEADYGYVDPLSVRSCYSESKRMGENLCAIWLKQYNIPVKIVRPAHTYGTTMDIINDNRVVSGFVKNIINKEDIKLNTSGESCRSFCYISDATVAFFTILFHGKDGEAYNLGNDEMYMSICDLANRVVDIFSDRDIKVSLNNNVREHDKMLMVSKKLENLGWNCKYDIREGLLRTVSYFEDKG